MKLVVFAALLWIQSTFAHTEKSFMKEWKILGSIQVTDMQSAMERMQELDIDVAGVDVENKIIDLLLTDGDYHQLEDLNYTVEILEVKGVTKGPDEEYKNPAEIEQILNDYYVNYPQLTHKISIGKSLEGRDIWAIKISDNPSVAEKDEPAVLFNSMHHAREIMTPEVAIDIIDYLVTRYDKDSRVKNWVDNNEIWVIPMFNVDGNNMMWTRDKWWRKNTRGGYGVDINRNYPSTWNKCNGSSGRRRSQTYRGESAGSEPETQAMMKFVAQTKPVFDISYHSYSEIVIYPYGCDGERVPNKNIVEKVGSDLANSIGYKAGTAWELLYGVDGGDIDWMYDAYQVIPFVVEVNSRLQGFHPSYAKWRDKTVERNRAGWMYLLDRVAQSGLRGRVKESFQSGVIEVKKAGKLIQTYRIFEDGRFHIVLNPGEYQFDFKINNNIKIQKMIEIKDDLVKIEI